MLKQVLDVLEILDDPGANGEAFVSLLQSVNAELRTGIHTVKTELGQTDFVKLVVPGVEGKTVGGSAPTLGVIGRLGGIGARPSMIGFVSDGDGAAAVLAAALKLAQMSLRGDRLKGDVIISTHICPRAPIEPHEPVPFMGSPVDMVTMNRNEVDPAMDAILSVDTTKGNKVLKHRGIGITPTAKEGWLLRVSPSLTAILERVTGGLPRVLALSMADITPYGNGVHHINSLMQPTTATTAPVVGVPITSAAVVAGSATGASHEVDIELAARFCVEVAKDFTSGIAHFYDPAEFARLVELYGSMRHLQTQGDHS